jgi:hypothetical protein
VYNPADAGNPPPAPSPTPAPAPPDADATAAPPRYQYLVSRLRNRQITMEEATELFAIQRQQVSVLLARTNALAAAAAVPSLAPRMVRPAAPRPAAPQPPAMASALEHFDPWGEGLLFLAASAGVLAALLKRAQGVDPTLPASKSAPASKNRNP